MSIGKSSASQEVKKGIIGLIRSLTGKVSKVEADPLSEGQREELSRLKAEIQSAMALIVQVREDVVTSEEQELEMVVKTLEEKLGVQAPDGAQPHEKLDWLMTELQSRNSEEKISILKELKGKNFKDKQLAETINDGLKKEVQDEIYQKAKDQSKEDVKMTLEQLEGDPDKSKKSRMDHKEFIQDMTKLLKTKQKEGKVKNKSNKLEQFA